MKTILPLLLLACCSRSAATAQTTDNGRPAPPFEVALLDDSIVNSARFDGEVIFLPVLRATLPNNPAIACARSIGLLNMINKEIIARFPDEQDLVVLPVFTRYASKQEITRLRARYRLAFPIALDKNKHVATRLAGDDAIHLFVIDRQGNVTEIPHERETTPQERARYKATTGQTLPPTRLSLEEAARTIEDALAAPPSGGILFQSLTLAEALAAAREENKLVLVYCYLPWYASAQHLLNRVFTRRAIGDYCNDRFVCVKFDMEEGEGVRLQERFRLSLTEPTTLFLTPDGAEIYRNVGSSPHREWLATISEAIKEE